MTKPLAGMTLMETYAFLQEMVGQGEDDLGERIKWILHKYRSDLHLETFKFSVKPNGNEIEFVVKCDIGKGRQTYHAKLAIPYVLPFADASPRAFREIVIAKFSEMAATEIYNMKIGYDFQDFWNAQSDWSQATFGLDSVRGPIGPLKHLAKEAKEASEAPGDIIEYADLLFLVVDATRRAGFTARQLLDACFEKLAVNRQRTWQKPTSPDEAVEHVREVEPRHSL